jgi:hypothetical protein
MRDQAGLGVHTTRNWTTPTRIERNDVSSSNPSGSCLDSSSHRHLRNCVLQAQGQGRDASGLWRFRRIEHGRIRRKWRHRIRGWHHIIHGRHSVHGRHHVILHGWHHVIIHRRRWWKQWNWRKWRNWRNWRRWRNQEHWRNDGHGRRGKRGRCRWCEWCGWDEPDSRCRP